jgi:hypothetical protein
MLFIVETFKVPFQNQNIHYTEVSGVIEYPTQQKTFHKTENIIKSNSPRIAEDFNKRLNLVICL